jgi:hypothetical protein
VCTTSNCCHSSKLCRNSDCKWWGAKSNRDPLEFSEEGRAGGEGRRQMTDEDR